MSSSSPKRAACIKDTTTIPPEWEEISKRIKGGERHSHVLQWAATWGHAESITLLHLLYGLTAEDAREDDNLALRLAAENGEAEVLKVLHLLSARAMPAARMRVPSAALVIASISRPVSQNLRNYASNGAQTVVPASHIRRLDSHEACVRRGLRSLKRPDSRGV